MTQYIELYTQLKFDKIQKLFSSTFIKTSFESAVVVSNTYAENIDKDFIITFRCFGKSHKYRCSAVSGGEDIFVIYSPQILDENDWLFSKICRLFLRKKCNVCFSELHSEKTVWIKKSSIGIEGRIGEQGVPIMMKQVKVLGDSLLIECSAPSQEKAPPLLCEKAILEFNFEGLALKIAGQEGGVKVAMPEAKDSFPKEIYRHQSTFLFEALLERLISSGYGFRNIVFLCFEGIDTEMYMNALTMSFPRAGISCHSISDNCSLLPYLRSSMAFHKQHNTQEPSEKFGFSINRFLDSYFGELHTIESVEGELYDVENGETMFVFEISVSIGRGSWNDIFINDNSVSLQHAKIKLLSADCAEIEDLNSTCGTFINGKWVMSKQVIYPGDYIRIGECQEFIFNIRKNRIGRTHIPCVRSLFY